MPGSDIRPKAWSDCHIYYNVKETLLFYPIRAQDLYYAQWRGGKARRNPLHITNRLRGFEPRTHDFQPGLYTVGPQMSSHFHNVIRAALQHVPSSLTWPNLGDIIIGNTFIMSQNSVGGLVRAIFFKYMTTSWKPVLRTENENFFLCISIAS